MLQLDVWGRLIYAVDGARGRRCGTACPPPLVVAAVRVRPSPNLPQYGRPRHCAAVVPTQPSALANCGRLSTEAAKSSICLGILHSYTRTVTLATVEGHRRRDECGTLAELRKPLRVILDIARERKMCRVGMCSLMESMMGPRGKRRRRPKALLQYLPYRYGTLLLRRGLNGCLADEWLLVRLLDANPYFITVQYKIWRR